MTVSTLLVGLILSLSLCELNSALKERVELTEERTGAGVSTEASPVKCKLQGTTRLPAFSLDGDYVIGGVFSIHTYVHTVKHNYTTEPGPLKCTGRLVSGTRVRCVDFRQCEYINVLICMLCLQLYKTLMQC